MIKSVLAALVLSIPVSTAGAAEYAPQEFDFSELGTVELVREVPLRDPLRDTLEHAVKPHTADEFLIRVDDGRALVLRQPELRLSPGQRVRLTSSTRGVLVAPQ